MEKTSRRTASATMADPLAKATVPPEAQVIDTDGTITTVYPANGTDFKLLELYLHTGSDVVQMINLPDGRTMWMDEEGKFNGKADNPTATKLTGGWLLPGDRIVGKVLVCLSKQVR